MQIAILGDGAAASFYRTSGGAEVDLVISWPDGREWAIEVKRSLAPKLGRGLRSALLDIEPERSFVVYPGEERFDLGAGIEAVRPVRSVRDDEAGSGPAPRHPRRLALAQVGQQDELQGLGEEVWDFLGLACDEALVGDPEDAARKGVL